MSISPPYGARSKVWLIVATKKRYQLCIVGGAGHVGLPLGVTFANAGVNTVLYDINESWIKKIEAGHFPFKERDGNRELQKALKRGTLHTTTVPEVIAQSEMILLVIGTPVDEYMNPDTRSLLSIITSYLPYFSNGQTIILRSTVYPGTSERLQKFLKRNGKKVSVAFCPERIAQGESLRELRELGQIVSAFDKKTADRVATLFKKISPSILMAKNPIEAELSKLFSNAWRYIKFATANQFYMMADSHGLDYHHIHDTMVKDYPRNRDLPKPGFAAGPCLFKDTMQLSAFNHNNFMLGHAAMLINEGMPNYVLQQIRRRTKQAPIKTIGILGMAFKAGSDDHRDSLSYKLKKIAEAHAHEVLCHDVYIKDKTFVPIKELIKRSDIIILATPHREYHAIKTGLYPKKLFVDIWNVWNTKGK